MGSLWLLFLLGTVSLSSLLSDCPGLQGRTTFCVVNSRFLALLVCSIFFFFCEPKQQVAGLLLKWHVREGWAFLLVHVLFYISFNSSTVGKVPNVSVSLVLGEIPGIYLIMQL